MLTVEADIPTILGPVHKVWTLNLATHTLQLRFKFHWPQAGLGRLRFIPFTLFPAAFDSSQLYVAAANGGDQLQSFQFGKRIIDHGKAVSFLVSAHQSLGITDGQLYIGDNSKSLGLSF